MPKKLSRSIWSKFVFYLADIRIRSAASHAFNSLSRPKIVAIDIKIQWIVQDSKVYSSSYAGLPARHENFWLQTLFT